MSTDPMTEFVAALTAAQRKRGWSDSQMADRLGVPRSTWATYRLGHERPGLEFVRKVAAVHGFQSLARPLLMPTRAKAAR